MSAVMHLSGRCWLDMRVRAGVLMSGTPLFNRFFCWLAGKSCIRPDRWIPLNQFHQSPFLCQGGNRCLLYQALRGEPSDGMDVPLWPSWWGGFGTQLSVNWDRWHGYLMRSFTWSLLWQLEKRALFTFMAGGIVQTCRFMHWGALGSRSESGGLARSCVRLYDTLVFMWLPDTADLPVTWFACTQAVSGLRGILGYLMP